MDRPIVTEHHGILVVRDDLYPGGTKARFLGQLLSDADELVYASPAEGGAQTAIAYCARVLGKRATIFVAKRAHPHPRSLMAKALGATVYQVTPGYLSVVQARARAYCAVTGAKLAPFGADYPEAISAITEAARSLDIDPAEVWCAAGSGVLARGLAAAWPKAGLHAVAVGRALQPREIAFGELHRYPRPFGAVGRLRPSFPSDPHYDAKAWEFCLLQSRNRPTLFWNVTGPAC